MATERQISANRANATKSTGPVTPEGKRISSQNAFRQPLFASTVVLKGESTRRFNDLAEALMLQFQPRNVAETALVQTMVAARWRLLRMWGIQTAAFELEMARARQNAAPSTAACGAVLAAIAFRTMADTSKALAVQLRLEGGYHRQFNQALSMLLKLRAMPEMDTPSDAPLNLTTETWSDDCPGGENCKEDRLQEENLPEDGLKAGDLPEGNLKNDDLKCEPNSEPLPQAEPAIETTRCHHSPRRRPCSSEPNSRAATLGASPRQPRASSASTQPAQPESSRTEVEIPPGSPPPRAATRIHGVETQRREVLRTMATVSRVEFAFSNKERQKHP